MVSVRYTPDAIKGDMDSVKTEVLDFYAKLVLSLLIVFVCQSQCSCNGENNFRTQPSGFIAAVMVVTV